MGKSELHMNDSTCCPLCGSAAFTVKRCLATVECRQCKNCALLFSAPLLKGRDEGFWSLVRRVRESDSQYGFIQLPYHQIAYRKKPWWWLQRNFEAH